MNLKIVFDDIDFNLTVGSHNTLFELKEMIVGKLKEKTNKNYDINTLKIKLGFPPKTLEGNSLDNQAITDLKITNNEMLRVDAKEGASAATIPPQPTGTSTTSTTMSNTESTTSTSTSTNESSKDIKSNHLLKRKVIPADNSCLFNAINFAVNRIADKPDTLRELVASVISDNLDEYNELVLEKDPFEYMAWILSSESWGGAIELSILSKLLFTNLNVVYIQSKKIETFGENFENSIYLLYDGIHYDLLVSNDSKEIGLFSQNDLKIKEDAILIAKELNEINKFVDTSNYSLKCNVCYALLQGNKEAVEHCKQTGHINFVNIK